MWAACRSRWWPFTLSPDVTSALTATATTSTFCRAGSPDFLQISCSACLLSLQFLQTHVAKRRDWCKVCSNDGSTASRDLLGQVALGQILVQASGKSRCIGQEQRHQRQRQVKMQVGSHGVTLDVVDLRKVQKLSLQFMFCLSPLVFVEPLFDISHEMIMPQIFTKVVLMSCMFGTHKELSCSTWGSKHLVSTGLKLNRSC